MKGSLSLRSLVACSTFFPACTRSLISVAPVHLSPPLQFFSRLMTKGKSGGKEKWFPKTAGPDVGSASAGHHSVVEYLADLHLDPQQEVEEAMSSKKQDVPQKVKKGEIGTLKKVKGTVVQAQLRATFYPKFENEKSDQEVRIRMHEVVAAGLGVLEVTMKHSGSLFLYSGDNGGAFAKNSFGNRYTAVGVFVLGRTLQEAWGPQAGQKQREFNAYLKEYHICVGMELVTAVLGDHGQRPLEDYVVVTAVTKLDGRPHFLSTADVVAFCHQWRLPTNQYWLFSTKASVSSFFTAYDAMCEEGLARTVTDVLNEIADTHLPATKRHEDIQGEILEGLVSRIVTPQSVTKLKEILVQFPPPPAPEALLYGNGLREICSSNRHSEKEQVEALLKAVGPDMCSDWADWLEDKVAEAETTKRTRLYPMLETFLHSTPADYTTKKLQEMIQVIHKSKLPVRFKCHTNTSRQSMNDQDNVVSHFKMTIHVLSDTAFRRYQREMRYPHIFDVCGLTSELLLLLNEDVVTIIYDCPSTPLSSTLKLWKKLALLDSTRMHSNPQSIGDLHKHSGLWPLYRGFFVEVQVFDGSATPAILNKESLAYGNDEETRGLEESGPDDSVDESENLMLKLKFLPYKIRTFLIRNGIGTLFDKGVNEYKEYYMRQMKIWGTSQEKQIELIKLLNEWAGYVKKRMKENKLSSNTYLSEAEPFLKQFAERSPTNQKLVGAAGVTVNVDGFLATAASELTVEDDHIPEGEHAVAPTTSTTPAQANKAQGLLVFFPGIPGCAKSALCKELMTSPDGLGSGLAVHSLMGDMIKGKYWPKLNDERVKKPQRITFADKNAPTKEVWQTIQKTCEATRSIGVPVVPESEGTGVNPYALDVLAVFIYRVLERANHPGHLDKNTPNPGYVLLLFYNLYDGMGRKEFEEELEHQFGHLVKIPVLKKNRTPMPAAVTGIMEDGLDLFRRHTNKHGRLDSLHGSLKEEWTKWEKRLKEILLGHSKHLLEIQIPFQEVVKCVQQQITAVASGDLIMHVPVDKEEPSFRTFKFVAIALSSDQVLEVLQEISNQNPQVENVLSKKSLKGSLGKAHITLAHKASHGVAAVAAYGPLRGTETQVQLSALLFSEELIALEVLLTPNGEKAVLSKNEWPHLTVWTASGVQAREANKLPQMVQAGEATCVEFQPITLSGHINFF